MPNWLKKQLKRAFVEKNKYQLRVLNQCWFYYQRTYVLNRKSK
ncbi:cortex morphogenetic protein CmpA [Alkalicoccobacillus plakortidis]|uniref:Cortex morphogenetic protein CmpA n=1 Tax=Alkalicoccobacillus plakortidis TaxID=444060 RepID=A0ABT0XMA0_9BACI|nr:cortex morphogenetic protein CmpA [Alkalicoccobacillus plakortidis]MCM2677030.1 cortex morphogenetic protein CmpA [Alkalicoccobacillus plakortidis]